MIYDLGVENEKCQSCDELSEHSHIFCSLKCLPLEEHIHWYGHGGTDINGEWEYSGSDYSDLRNGIGTGLKFNYHIELYSKRCYNRKLKSYGKLRGYSFTITLSDYLSGWYVVGKGSASSRNKSKTEIVKLIREFESSNRFKDEVWSKVSHVKNLQIIVKEFVDRNGENSYLWVATTWKTGWDLISSRYELKGFESCYTNSSFYSGNFYIYSYENRTGDYRWSKIYHMGYGTSGSSCKLEDLPFVPDEVIGKGIGEFETDFIF